MELEYKTLRKYESFGGKGAVGIQILVSIDRPFTEADERAASKISDELMDSLLLETMRLDPDAAVEREVERQQLLGLFNGQNIFTEELPNGYCSRACCSQRPWYRVTTKKGRITLGWRKRVIEIAWEPSVAGEASLLFPNEDVTKGEHKGEQYIHAWSYDKAKQYIHKLLEG